MRSSMRSIWRNGLAGRSVGDRAASIIPHAVNSTSRYSSVQSSPVVSARAAASRGCGAGTLFLTTRRLPLPKDNGRAIGRCAAFVELCRQWALTTASSGPPRQQVQGGEQTDRTSKREGGAPSRSVEESVRATEPLDTADLQSLRGVSVKTEGSRRPATLKRMAARDLRRMLDSAVCTVSLNDPDSRSMATRARPGWHVTYSCKVRYAHHLT